MAAGSRRLCEVGYNFNENPFNTENHLRTFLSHRHGFLSNTFFNLGS